MSHELYHMVETSKAFRVLVVASKKSVKTLTASPVMLAACAAFTCTSAILGALDSSPKIALRPVSSIFVFNRLMENLVKSWRCDLASSPARLSPSWALNSSTPLKKRSSTLKEVNLGMVPKILASPSEVNSSLLEVTP